MNRDDLETARTLKRLVREMSAANAAVPLFPDEIYELGRRAPSFGSGTDGEIRYFRVQGSASTAIFRVRWADDGLWLEQRAETGWLNDPSLLAYFIGTAHGAIEIDEPAEAEE